MEKLRIMSVFGTRPEAIKMAPLVKELASREEIESLCCVTAQHREMLDSVMEVFDLKADCDLDIMTPRQTLSTITSKCLLGMDDTIEQLKPDMILVHGDTSTTFAGAGQFLHKVTLILRERNVIYVTHCLAIRIFHLRPSHNDLRNGQLQYF